MNSLRWRYYELKRLIRLMRPEPSVRLLVYTIGPFWLWRHGAKREFKIYPWGKKVGYWYAPDLALPHRLLAIEADGAPHFTRQGRKRDVVRDQALSDKGWQIIRVTEAELKSDPRGYRRRLRRYLRG